MFGKEKKDWRESLSWPGALLVFVFLALIYVSADGFGIWYLGEDFGWLQWTRDRDFWEVVKPFSGNYYRPLAVNIPYFFFTRIAAGIIWWRVLAFTVVCLTGYLFWKWIHDLARDSWVALALTSVWLLSPSQSYGLLYLNALDYILTLFFLVAFLLAFQRRNFPLAFGIFLIGIFSKELLLGLPIFFLLFRKQYKISWHYFLLGMVAVGVFIYGARGLAVKEATIGGFSISTSAIDIWKQFCWLAKSVFWGFGSSRGIWLWFPLAWICVLLSFAVYFFRKGAKERTISFYLVALLFFFLPLIFLGNIQSEDLGPIYWIFLFGAAAAALGGVDLTRFPKIKVGVALALTSLALAYSFRVDGYRRRYVIAGENYFQLASSALPILSGCGPLDQIVVSGMELFFPLEATQEFAMHALRAVQPGAKFYLVRRLGAASSGARLDPYFWVNEAQAQGHPRLEFSRLENGRISARWARGSAKCRTSAESIRPRIFLN